MSVLSVEKLVKRFVGPDGRPLAAVDELSFELPEEARLITIAGPDGAGKSTLLRLLVGLLTPDAGDIRVLGLSPDKASLSGRTGFMPQKFGLYQELTVLENLEIFAELRSVPKDEARARFAQLLALTGLAGFEDRRSGALSGGMKQKLGLATSLLATPELLFLDEPTVGVDPLSRRELKNILRTRTETTGMRAIMTTSNLAEAEEADLVLLMDKGRLLDVTTPEAARRRLSRRTFLLRAADPADAKTLTRGALDLVNAEMGEAAPFLDASPKADGVAVFLADEAKEADLVIEAEEISRRFGNFTAVADTSFTVKKGEIFGLLGPNGAGKTTTFRMLCGLLAPSSGNIHVCGVSLEEAKSEVRSRIGYVAQKFSLYDKLTVRQNLDYFGRSYGLWGRRLRERVAESIELFRLTPYANERTDRLPLGAKRELAFAAALLHHPDILFLDEATSGADVEARRTFWRRIVALSRLGVTTIVTTHYMEEAHYCDRFLIQDRGRVLILGTPDEVRRAGATPDNPEPTMEEAFVEIVERSREEAAS